MNAPSDEELLTRLAEIPDAGASGAQRSARAPLRASAPGRDATRKRRVVALLLSLLWVGVNLAFFGLRPDLRTLPLSYVEAEIAVPLLLAAGCLVASLATGRLGLGANVGLLAALAVSAPMLFGLLGATVPLPDASAPGSSSLVSAFVCLSLTTVWAAVPLLLASIALRSAFPVASPRRGALLGAAAGLLAGATINLHCPNVAHFHLFVGHALPVVAATLLGAFVVSRWTRS